MHIPYPIDVPTIDAIAAQPDRARELPRHALFELAIRCATAQGVLLAALALAPEPRQRSEDRLLNTREAAGMLGRTPDWLYRHADSLPFTVREHGHRPRFSFLGIQRYIDHQAALQAAGKGA